jgi:hypothetical protein
LVFVLPTHNFLIANGRVNANNNAEISKNNDVHA